MSCNFTIDILDYAQSDLLQIVENFTVQCNSPKLAVAFLDDYQEKLDIIKKQPLLYQIDPNPRLAKQMIRRIPINGYMIYYKAYESKQHIEIGRILSEKQDNTFIVF